MLGIYYLLDNKLTNQTISSLLKVVEFLHTFLLFLTLLRFLLRYTIIEVFSVDKGREGSFHLLFHG